VKLKIVDSLPKNLPRYCWACIRRWKEGDVLTRFGNDWICIRCHEKATRAIYVPNRLLNRRAREVEAEL
jgi:hypothetical protein